MRYELLKNNIRVSETLQKAIDTKVAKITERLKRYHPETAHLEVKLNQQEDNNGFECSLNLKAFKDALFAKKSAPELRVAVDKSFDAIMKELDHYRNKINKSLQHG